MTSRHNDGARCKPVTTKVRCAPEPNRRAAGFATTTALTAFRGCKRRLILALLLAEAIEELWTKNPAASIPCPVNANHQVTPIGHEIYISKLRRSLYLLYTNFRHNKGLGELLRCFCPDQASWANMAPVNRKV
mmetsp:Transcript_5572/g.12932  ORF Transcript_5572/g.12932 Transcript_5572/m.12932 type:complete len:133 (-) Transcript_5572:226-624(-)